MTTEAGEGSRPREVVLGLDVGTTAVKAVAFGVGYDWRHVAQREYPLLAPEQGWRVQDPEALHAAVLDALAEAVAASRGSTVLAVSVSTAAHALIGLDAELQPVTPVATWADARSTDEARWLRERDLVAAIHARTGTPVHPMTPLTKLMWFGRHEPATVAAVRWWVGLKSLVLAQLTGTLATELSSASATALFDVRRREWDAEALELAGVSADHLPPVLPTTATLPMRESVADRIGLPGPVPVVAGAADGPLATLGANALSRGVVGLSVGTSGAARMLVDGPVTDDHRLFCYALTDDKWVLGGAISNGGSVVRWASGVFGRGGADAPDEAQGHQDEAVLALASAVPAGSDGLVMLPYLLPERAPLWDPDLTGAFLGMRHGHTRGHFVRAAVEGVALQLSLVVDLLDRTMPVTAVRATGGVFRSSLWRQAVAAALDRPLTITTGAEGTALGAAALALLALGRVHHLAAAVAALDTGEQDEVQPTSDADAAVYVRLRGSVPALLESYAPVAALLQSPDDDPREPGDPGGRAEAGR